VSPTTALPGVRYSILGYALTQNFAEKNWGLITIPPGLKIAPENCNVEIDNYS
jgi:hypothetical protein